MLKEKCEQLLGQLREEAHLYQFKAHFPTYLSSIWHHRELQIRNQQLLHWPIMNYCTGRYWFH
jgi:hypothetical protein